MVLYVTKLLIHTYFDISWLHVLSSFRVWYTLVNILLVSTIKCAMSFPPSECDTLLLIFSINYCSVQSSVHKRMVSVERCIEPLKYCLQSNVTGMWCISIKYYLMTSQLTKQAYWNNLCKTWCVCHVTLHTVFSNGCKHCSTLSFFYVLLS